MHVREYPEFKDLLEELASCYPGTDLPNSRAELYFEVLKPFSLRVIRRAGVALMGELEFFPKAAELKLQCLGLAREEDDEARGTHAEREIRCQHRSYDRPAGPDGERQQCVTVIPLHTPDQDHGPEVYYCPAHRPQYRAEARATDVEIDRVLVDLLHGAPDCAFFQEVVANRATNQALGQSVTQAALHGVLKAFTTRVYGRADTLKAMGGDDLADVSHDPKVVEANTRRRAEQLRLAEEAGLGVREPGEDDQ